MTASRPDLNERWTLCSTLLLIGKSELGRCQPSWHLGARHISLLCRYMLEHVVECTRQWYDSDVTRSTLSDLRVTSSGKRRKESSRFDRNSNYYYYNYLINILVIFQCCYLKCLKWFQGKCLACDHIITCEMCNQQSISHLCFNSVCLCITARSSYSNSIVFLGARLWFVYFDISMENHKNGTD